MSCINFKSIVAGESPRERHKYILLDSPKSGTAIHPKLPLLVILSLVIGIILGGTWNKIDARTDPCTQSTRSSGSLDGYLLRNQNANGSFLTQWSNISVNRVDSQLQKPNVNSLSVAWLMSFPVSYSEKLPMYCNESLLSAIVTCQSLSLAELGYLLHKLSRQDSHGKKYRK